jgi:hypothetical protein
MQLATYLKGEYQVDIHLFLLIIAGYWFACYFILFLQPLGKLFKSSRVLKKTDYQCSNHYQSGSTRRSSN